MKMKYHFFNFVSVLVVLGLMLNNTESAAYAQEGVPPALEPVSTELPPTKPPTTGSLPIERQAWSQFGWFSIIWGDSLEGTSQTVYTLTDDRGQTTILMLDETLAQSLGGVLSFNRKYVNVQGVWASPLTGHGTSIKLNVTSISFASPPGTETLGGVTSAAVTGNKPWISIMCKFSDYADEPKNLAYFQGMYANVKPGLDHYWRELSYDTINLVGSNASGWFVLPQPEAYYNPTNTDGGTDLVLLATDCIAAADASVNFAPYSGINMMFNTDYNNGIANGGSMCLTLDGVTKCWSTTWEPPWGYEQMAVMAHEMGHGFGLPHSSGNYGQTYDNVWDVMSDTWSNCNKSTDPTYGCLGQHTISYHLDKLGWIPPGQKFTATAGSATITLEQLALPQTSNYKMAQIPIGGSSTHFYTVEARRLTGYDVKLAGAAVIIHEVDTTRDIPANVIDADGNGDTNDAGAMWVVGETFTDESKGISVTVLSATSTGFQVSITTKYIISGNAGEAGVILSYTDGTAKTATTDGFGLYYFPVSNNWSGTVTLSKIGYTFTPASKSYVNIQTDQTNQNYTAVPIPGTPTWTPTGSMAYDRSLHKATLLPNGKVLVAGGGPFGRSAELYDPATGLWTVTGSLTVARWYASATLLPNGKVLVASGVSAELYDPATGLWTATGSLVTAIEAQTATLLPNGKVLVVSSFNASAQLYDPATGLWTATGSPVTANVDLIAILLSNGKVLLVEGNGGCFPATAELYDPITGLWAATGSLVAKRGGYTATLLPNGKVLVAGGRPGDVSAELYDPATGLWTPTGSMAAAREFHTATLLPNGKVLVLGGGWLNPDVSVLLSTSLPSAELYDPATGLWTYTGSLAAARFSHSVTLLANGKVLTAGGDGGANTQSLHLTSAELYSEYVDNIYQIYLPLVIR